MAIDSEYQVDGYMYPQDLTSNPKYGGNFALFYINVTADSKLGGSLGEGQYVSNPTNRGARGDLIGQGFTSGQATVAAGLQGLIAGTAGGAALNIGGGSGGIFGGALLAGAAAVTPKPPTLTRPTKRLKTAIALYMPSQMSIRYGMQYEEESMAGAQMLLKGGQALVQAATGNPGKALDTLKDAAPGAIANLALGAGGVMSAIGVGSGLAANPKKEQVFKGVDFRTFQLSYQFFPKDDDEARNVRNIIHQFKYHMHPEFKDTDGFLYIYPSEFDIVYYSGNAENPNVHKHTSCVLKDININYTPQGQFNAFADGMPLQVNIDMTFLELALITKDKIGMTPEEGGL